jgi:hypothetical protein
MGVSEPPITGICLGGDRVLMIVEDGLDRGDAANRSFGCGAAALPLA